MCDYKVAADNDSLYNTPPTFAVYMAGLVFEWLRENGGLPAIEATNARKARLCAPCLGRASAQTVGRTLTALPPSPSVAHAALFRAPASTT